MTREEAHNALLGHARALARRNYDDAPTVFEAIKVLNAPLGREEIMRAVNIGTDLATEAMGEAGFVTGDQAYNIANLVVNAIGSVLDRPDDELTMADVLAENFDESSMPDYRAELGEDVIAQALELRKADA